MWELSIAGELLKTLYRMGFLYADGTFASSSHGPNVFTDYHE